MPDEPEALGLLALMLLHDARRATRVDERGALVLLADQDRARWDRARSPKGVALVERALRRSRDVGAGRTSCRPRSPRSTAEARDRRRHRLGRRSSALYGELRELDTVARRRAQPRRRGRDGRAARRRGSSWSTSARRGALDGMHLFHATRADLLRRLGRDAESGRGLRAGHRASRPTIAERDFLARRLAGVRGSCMGDRQDRRARARRVARRVVLGEGRRRCSTTQGVAGRRGRPAADRRSTTTSPRRARRIDAVARARSCCAATRTAAR